MSTSIPAFGHFFPKNCLCHKQLGQVGCPRPFYKEPSNCYYYQFWSWRETYCYTIKGVPDERQFSDPPDGPGDSRYQWKIGIYNTTAAQLDRDPFETQDSGPPMPYELPDRTVLLPIDKCPNRCYGRGWCVRPNDPPHETACKCLGFFKGKMCEEPLNEHCYQNCSGRGTCSGGWCKCDPGYWGLGCTRSKAYTADVWLPHPTKLKVYVYDIPEHIAFKKPWHDLPALLDTMYLAEVAFMDQLLGDWGVRTENPWEANLFVVSTYTIYYTGNIGFPAKHFSTVFNYVRTRFPFWNMTAGRNHVAIATNDRGCCDLYKLARQQPELQQPIKLVHFAQAGRFGRGGASGSDPAYEAAVREFQRLRPGAHSVLEDDEGAEGAVAGGGADLGIDRVRFRGIPAYSLDSLRMEREPCFRPEQDVAIPNYLERSWLQHIKAAYEWVAPPEGAAGPGRMRHKPLERKYLFHFHGFTKPDMAYSGGVRQGFFAMYSNITREDMAINKGNGAEWMLQSRFCMAPLGYGWGIRLTQAMHTGCVPVLVQDHVYTAFWDLLPYEKFSVRVTRHNLHRLFDLLEAITPEQLADLQQGLADYHMNFVWHPDVGGLAYNNTITSLHRRLLNLWTALFRSST
ncbi:hypothetical protein GPECTOR_54g212 [Gonium pectorale]|uniref:EGF-like domain-containing protein n=1 Tax=Gonium pectorale TaxID=33097 RepID=A0A150G6M0_GONPE|nr:hypothetical protein GPECTOR_54g212 [Gonium pectorale]|eukprot:KXZ45471.1 hypothetical protein GPECTOR_54g212 [Gonium pectorale]